MDKGCERPGERPRAEGGACAALQAPPSARGAWKSVALASV